MIPASHMTLCSKHYNSTVEWESVWLVHGLRHCIFNMTQLELGWWSWKKMNALFTMLNAGWCKATPLYPFRHATQSCFSPPKKHEGSLTQFQHGHKVLWNMVNVFYQSAGFALHPLCQGLQIGATQQGGWSYVFKRLCHQNHIRRIHNKTKSLISSLCLL